MLLCITANSKQEFYLNMSGINPLSGSSRSFNPNNLPSYEARQREELKNQLKKAQPDSNSTHSDTTRGQRLAEKQNIISHGPDWYTEKGSNLKGPGVFEEE